MKIIETENLTKYYGKSRGILDVNLSVEEGDFFGFIGPNGAGKSTTIRTLLGLLTPTSGSANIFGLDVTKDTTKILTDIGYLPSEAMFYQGMKVKEILEFSAKIRHKDCKEEARILCERLDLDPSRKVSELSLGNRKKVGIICALQHHPKLYILDEPTSGLDPLMQREFYSILKERNENGATVFLSSHILSEVGRYCKHAAVIREGRILVSDSMDRLGHSEVKQVTLRGLSSPLAIDNIRDVKTENDAVQFLFHGNANALLKELHHLTFDDVNINDPDLEEVFMHYYAKEEN